MRLFILTAILFLSGCIAAPQRAMYMPPIAPVQWMPWPQPMQAESPGEQWQRAYIAGQGFRAGYQP